MYGTVHIGQLLADYVRSIFGSDTCQIFRHCHHGHI